MINRKGLMDINGAGTLEEQLEAIENANFYISNRNDLDRIEELAKAMEERLILDNRHTKHSALSLAQSWDQLRQFTLRLKHTLVQQLEARTLAGVSEESLKEFTMMFKHFDRERTGALEHREFKSCLRALGYDLPVEEADGREAEFDTILDHVDPNRTGKVYLHDFITYMIERESENVSSKDEVLAAFRACSNDRPYVTRDELRAVSFNFDFLLLNIHNFLFFL